MKNEPDKALNEEAVRLQGAGGRRILSAYYLSDKTKIWVITYPGHETTLLLPEEY